MSSTPPLKTRQKRAELGGGKRGRGCSQAPGCVTGAVKGPVKAQAQVQLRVQVGVQACTGASLQLSPSVWPQGAHPERLGSVTSPQQDSCRTAGREDLLDPVPHAGTGLLCSHDGIEGLAEHHGPRQTGGQQISSEPTHLSSRPTRKVPNLKLRGTCWDGAWTPQGPQKCLSNRCRPGRPEVVTRPGGGKRVNPGGLPGGAPPPRRCEQAGASMLDPCVHCPFSSPGGRQGAQVPAGTQASRGHWPPSPRGVGKRSSCLSGGGKVSVVPCASAVPLKTWGFPPRTKGGRCWPPSGPGQRRRQRKHRWDPVPESDVPSSSPAAASLPRVPRGHGCLCSPTRLLRLTFDHFVPRPSPQAPESPLCAESSDGV